MNFNRLVYWTHTPAYSHTGPKRPKQPLSPNTSDDEQEDEEIGMISKKRKSLSELRPDGKGDEEAPGPEASDCTPNESCNGNVSEGAQNGSDDSTEADEND